MKLLLTVALLLWPLVASAQPSVTPSAYTASPGGSLYVTVANGPGSTIDWITVAAVGSPATSYHGIWFLNGTAIPPASGLTGGTFPISVPTYAGYYEVRFLASGYYGLLASSAPITVGTPGTPPPVVPPPPIPPITDQRILFHGDSNTTHIYSSGANNWATIVGTTLGYVDIQNLAISGAASDQALIDLPEILHMHPDLVVLMFGTNDMEGATRRGTPHAEMTAKYLRNIQTVITALRDAQIATVVLSPIFTLNARETARYPDWVAGLKTICMLGQVQFLDVWGHMASLSEVQTKEQFEAYYRVPSLDAWHLSDAGHAMLAEFVIRKLTP